MGFPEALFRPIPARCRAVLAFVRSARLTCETLGGTGVNYVKRRIEPSFPRQLRDLPFAPLPFCPAIFPAI
jgi:hypothetical protein